MMPFQWTVNPYRGCEFGCKYCYARYTHEFMELRDDGAFENRIYAKKTIGPLLKAELRAGAGEGGIAIGTATDPYQPAERRYGRTREVLETLAGERGLDISITTKSDLVRRDIPVLREIARLNNLSVNMTVTTVDPDLARMLEPRAPRPSLRLAAVRELTDAGICAGVYPNPIMPLITDQEASLDALGRAAKEHGAVFLAGGVLFLKPSAQKVFFPFLDERFPHLARRYRERYEKDAYLRGPYRDQIKKRLMEIRARYGLLASPPARAAEAGPQGVLFA